MPNLLSAEQLETYQSNGYLCPFTAFPAEVAQSYYQKLLDFEHEIGDDPAPRFNNDPLALKALKDFQDSYRDPTLGTEAQRAEASR